MSDRIDRLMRTIGEAGMTCSLCISTWGHAKKDVHVQFIAQVWAPIPEGTHESPYCATARGFTAFDALKQAYDEARAWAGDVQP